MKTFLLISLALISSYPGPDKSAKKIFKILRSGENEKIEAYYLTKNEFSSLLQEMDPGPPAAQIERMLENYAGGKESFLLSFNQNTSIVDWNMAKLDSTKYDYIIAKPGNDEKVLWPDSKRHQVKDSDLTKVVTSIFLHDENGSYLMKFEMMNYKGKWKFIFWLKPPFIQRMTSD